MELPAIDPHADIALVAKELIKDKMINAVIEDQLQKCSNDLFDRMCREHLAVESQRNYEPARSSSDLVKEQYVTAVKYHNDRYQASIEAYERLIFRTIQKEIENRLLAVKKIEESIRGLRKMGLSILSANSAQENLIDEINIRKLVQNMDKIVVYWKSRESYECKVHIEYSVENGQLYGTAGFVKLPDDHPDNGLDIYDKRIIDGYPGMSLIYKRGHVIGFANNMSVDEIIYMTSKLSAITFLRYANSMLAAN